MGCTLFASERDFIFHSVLMVWITSSTLPLLEEHFLQLFFKPEIRLFRLLCLDLYPFPVGRNLTNQLRNPINYVKPFIIYLFYVLIR